MKSDRAPNSSIPTIVPAKAIDERSWESVVIREGGSDKTSSSKVARAGPPTVCAIDSVRVEELQDGVDLGWRKRRSVECWYCGKGAPCGEGRRGAEGKRTGPIPALLKAARARKGDSQHP